MLLSEAWKMYEADKRIEGFSVNTLDAKRLQIRLLMRYLGDKDINDITLIKLKEYIANDTGRLKPSTIGSRIRCLRSFFAWSHNEGLITVNPAYKLKEPKLGMRIPKFIPEEELELIRDSARGALEKALINLTYSSGARIGEIFSISLNDVNWEKRSIIIIGKGNKQREILFDTKAYLWLKEYVSKRNDDCEALFVTERKPYRRTSIAQLRRVIKRIAERAKVPNIYPHRLRHSFATHLVDRGCPLEVISNLCGHSRTDVTKVYAHLSGERRREQYRKYF